MPDFPIAEETVESRRVHESNRAYGIDLLKICAMVAIVATHILRRGGWGLQPTTQVSASAVKSTMLQVVDAALLCHVNCFVLASGWIMARKEFRLGRIFKLWLLVFGYSMAFLLIAAIFMPQVSLNVRSLARCFLPLTRDSYWFFTQYCGLFFLMPVLNLAVEKLNVRTLQIILLACFVLFSIHPMFFGCDIFHVSHGYSVLWFSYLYMIAATMSQHRLFVGTRIPVAIVVILGCVFTTVVGRVFINGLCGHYGLASREHVFSAYNSPLILIQSIAAFVVFCRIPISSVRWTRAIAFIAPSVFAVYLIHSNFIFRQATHWDRLWGSLLDGTDTVGSVAVVFGGAMIVFIMCLIADFARRGISCILKRNVSKINILKRRKLCQRFQS